MKKLLKPASFLVIVALLVMFSIAAAPAKLPSPAPPTVVATGNGGELHVSWNPIPGTKFYTVGYANRNDVRQIHADGGDVLDAFYYVTLGSTYSQYTLTSLQPESPYVVLIGAQNTRFGDPEISFGRSSAEVMTAGLHGEGFCPITGLQIPDEGYLTVGETATWTNYGLTLDTATAPPRVPLSDGTDYAPYQGRKLLRLCTTQSNQTGGDVYFQTGTHNNVSTDRGIGFSRVTEWGDIPITDGSTKSACDTWSIPGSATVAVYAIDDATNPNVLFRIELSSIPTTIPTSGSTNTTDTASVINRRHIEQKQYMLDVINSERADAGVGSVTLGDNVAAQLQAEAGLENCFTSHWGLDGLKPYMRYSLETWPETPILLRLLFS